VPKLKKKPKLLKMS